MCEAITSREKESINEKEKRKKKILPDYAQIHA